MRFVRTTPPRTPPGLPQLVATYTGSTRTQRIVVLEFFSPDGVPAALGRRARLEGAEVISRQNVAILYLRQPRGRYLGNTLRRLLDGTRVRAG